MLTSYGSFQLEKDEFFQWPINRFTLTGEIDDNYSDNKKTTITVHFSKESEHDKPISHYNYLSVSVKCLINGQLKTYKVTREDLLWSTVATEIEKIFKELNIKRK